MPALGQDRGNGIPNAKELPEYPVRGPFGGIQSEIASDQIGTIGYNDAVNIMFRLGRARVRPKIGPGIASTPYLVRISDLGGTIAEQLWSPDGAPFYYYLRVIPIAGPNPYGPQLSTNGAIGFLVVVTFPFNFRQFNPDTGIYEEWTSIFDFYTAGGVRILVAATLTQLYYLTPSGWVRLYGVFAGNSPVPMSFAVVGQKLCMSNGLDVIKTWDGTQVGPTDAFVDEFNPSLSAPAARYLFEFGNHLVALNLITSGSQSYQGYQWSGAGDPTDWTSFDSGSGNLSNDLGPINGGIKLFQYGFIFQQLGIVQMSLTGNAAQPFYLQPLTARSKGLAISRTLCANGESTCYYVGQDNVYMFDGTTSQPVGDSPVQGRARLGARSRIFQDIMLADPTQIFGFVSTAVNGNPYNAYWLVIPNVGIWIFHIDDQTWTRWTVAGTPTCVGNYLSSNVIRIADLIGTIAQQNWTPATLLNPNLFPSVMIGFADGSTGLFDFTGWSEEPWSLTTGELDYDDQRHENSTKKLRLTYKDNGECLIQVVFTNEEGDTYTNAPTSPGGVILPGTGSGKMQKIVLPIDLPSIYATVQLSGEAGVPLEISSVAPIYSQGGEVKNAL